MSKAPGDEAAIYWIIKLLFCGCDIIVRGIFLIYRKTCLILSISFL